MKKLLSAALAALFVCVSAVTPARALDMVTWPYGVNPQTQWWNQWERNEQLALGQLIYDMTGRSTTSFYSNLAIVPTSGLNVAVQPANTNTVGSLYQYLADDTNTMGGPGVTALPADPNQIYLQGLLYSQGPAIGPLNPPGTSGQSIDYLIECQVQTVNTNSVTVNYVSSLGVVNSGAWNRDRLRKIGCQPKAGTAAATGSQLVPSADSGWLGIDYVAVAYGTSTITAGMIPAPTGALAPFGGFATANVPGAQAIDTSLTPQTKAGAFGSNSYILAGAGTTPNGVTIGDVWASRSTTTGALGLGGSTEYGFWDYNVNNPHGVTLSSFGVGSTQNLYLGPNGTQGSLFANRVFAAGYVLAGAATTPTSAVSTGDVWASRSTTTGVLGLGGSAEYAFWDYNVNNPHSVTLSAIGTGSTQNLYLGPNGTQGSLFANKATLAGALAAASASISTISNVIGSASGNGYQIASSPVVIADGANNTVIRPYGAGNVLLQNQGGSSLLALTGSNGNATLTGTLTVNGTGASSFAGAIQGSSNGAATAYVPPVYTNTGASTASTEHALRGQVTCAVAANVTVGTLACSVAIPTLSGAAVFASATSYQANATALSGAFAVNVTGKTTTGFTVNVYGLGNNAAQTLTIDWTANGY